jgi:predicted Na+-dependent transporter
MEDGMSAMPPVQVQCPLPLVVRINRFVRGHFVHLISLVALISFLAPGLSSTLRAPRLGPLDASGASLFLMMLSAAIQCSLGAMRGVFTRPRALAVCLAQYFVVLPLSCWALSHLCVPLLGAKLGEPIQLGLELVILMPVAATASIWVRDTKGDLELLVSLVVITMSIGVVSAPAYLWLMSGLSRSSIIVPPLTILRQLAFGVLLPLCTGVVLNKLLRPRLARVQPYFGFLGNLGLFLAVFLNVGIAAPMLRTLSFRQIAISIAIVLVVNLANFILGGLMGRLGRLRRGSQVTCEFSSGMRSNGTALVVGLASFPGVPLVTVPAAIYIIFQHLLAGVVRSRLAARFADEVTPIALRIARP